MVTSRFAVGIHILSLLEINKDGVNTSDFLASSVGTNPVVIRRITGMLHKAGLVEVKPGVAGAKLNKKVSDITLLDVYRAVDAVDEEALFSVHNSPNPACVVGRNIQSSIVPIFSSAQKAMEDQLNAVTIADVIYDLSQKEQKTTN